MNSKSLPLFRGELALCIAVLMNSFGVVLMLYSCLLYTSPSPRDGLLSRMPSSA